MSRWRDTKQSKKSKKKIETNVTSINTFEPCASIASRLKAFLTDSFLITTPILYLVLYFIMGGGDSFAQSRVEGWSLIFGIHMLVILFFWLRKGQTPGLKAYSLKLISNNTKERISFFKAILRYFATLFSIISFFLIFLPFFRKDKRTFQDILSNSYVIDE